MASQDTCSIRFMVRFRLLSCIRWVSRKFDLTFDLSSVRYRTKRSPLMHYPQILFDQWHFVKWVIKTESQN